MVPDDNICIQCPKNFLFRRLLVLVFDFIFNNAINNWQMYYIKL